MTKALVERLDLSRTHSFSIQTLAENGTTSQMVDTLFSDVRHEVSLPPEGDNQPERDSAVNAEWDMSSIISSTHPDDGERRVVGL